MDNDNDGDDDDNVFYFNSSFMGKMLFPMDKTKTIHVQRGIFHFFYVR